MGPTPCERVLYDCCTLGVQLSLFRANNGVHAISTTFEMATNFPLRALNRAVVFSGKQKKEKHKETAKRRERRTKNEIPFLIIFIN
jgi:hypothetical protein